MTIIEDFQRQVSGSMHGNLEAELQKALRSVEDREWLAHEVRQRSQIIVFGSGPNKVTEFRVDGKALLEVYPETLETEQTDTSYILRVTQNYRRLYSQATTGGDT